MSEERTDLTRPTPAPGTSPEKLPEGTVTIEIDLEPLEDAVLRGLVAVAARYHWCRDLYPALAAACCAELHRRHGRGEGIRELRFPATARALAGGAAECLVLLNTLIRLAGTRPEARAGAETIGELFAELHATTALLLEPGGRLEN